MMQETCKVCGAGIHVVRSFSRIIYGVFGYCSIRCSLISQAKYTFVFALFFGIVATMLIILIPSVALNSSTILLIFGILAGVLSILLFILSALGFYFKRQDDS